MNEPQRVQKVNINYAKVAKKVDVKALKSSIWSELCGTPATAKKVLYRWVCGSSSQQCEAYIQCKSVATCTLNLACIPQVGQAIKAFSHAR